MRVAMLVRNFPMVSETFVINQAVGLIDRGHEVDLYAIDPPVAASGAQPIVDRPALVDRLRRLPERHRSRSRDIRATLYDLLVAGAVHPRATAEALSRALRPVGRDDRRDSGIRQLLRRWTLPMIGRAPFDVIHCQFGTTAADGIRLRRYGSPGARLIVTFRGFDISQYVRELGEHIYDEVFDEADFILTNCDFFRRRLAGMGADESRLEVLRSGLDPSGYPFEARRPPLDGPIRIAMVGRLVEKKGTEYAIRAAARLIDRGRRVELRVIGDGPLRPALLRLIDDLGVASHVRLLGAGATPEIIAELRQAHLFIAPSVTAAQGDQDAPINVLKEAMATGLPVVSTRHGGIPELVDDGVSGLLAPERDDQALADRLDELIARPERWPAMGASGRATVERDYNLGRLNDRLVEIYQHAIDTPRSRPTPLPGARQDPALEALEHADGGRTPRGSLGKPESNLL